MTAASTSRSPSATVPTTSNSVLQQADQALGQDCVIVGEQDGRRGVEVS